MASVKQIIFVIGISVFILGSIWWFLEQKNTPPELLLGDAETLSGPLSPEELKINNPEITNPMNRIVTLQTNKGDIEIELFEDTMPITTGNFIKLAEEGYYDGTKFHRVINNFMIQGGDSNSKDDNTSTYGQGGPGYTIQDEFVKGALLSNVRGTIAMANTGQPNSGGSQFFINTIDNTNLDFDKEPFSSKHPVFGRVISGMDVVDVISDVETTTTASGPGLPVEPIVIEAVIVSSPEPLEPAE